MLFRSDEAFSGCSKTPQISAEASQLDTLGEMVKAELGVAIVPEICRPQMEAKGLSCMTLDDENLSRNVGVVYTQMSGLSAAASSFWDMLLANFKKG